MALVRHRVDWPLWHEHQSKTYFAKQRGEPHFDPWEYADECSGAPTIYPIDFFEVYDALWAVCGRDAPEFVLNAWHYREIIDTLNPPQDRTLSDAELANVTRLRGVVSATEAPLEVLLDHAKREDYKFFFASIGRPKPLRNDDAAAWIGSNIDSPEVVSAFRACPRWKAAYYMTSPVGMNWGDLQNFRYLLKCMAQDFPVFSTGFRVFRLTY
jgi:hypothetical protein